MDGRMSSQNRELPAFICRAARAMLDWTIAQCAAECRIGRATIQRFEHGTGKISSLAMDRLIETFEANDIVFVVDKTRINGLIFDDPKVFDRSMQPFFDSLKSGAFDSPKKAGNR